MSYPLKTAALDQFGAIRKAVGDGNKSLRFVLGLDLDRTSCALAVIINGGAPSFFGKYSRESIVELVGELRTAGFEVASIQEACGRRKMDKSEAKKLVRQTLRSLGQWPRHLAPGACSQ